MAFIHFAHASTASTEPWKRPGASELPVSAITPMRISVGEMPTSEAVSASLPPEPPLCAVAVPANAVATNATAAMTAIERIRLTLLPWFAGMTWSWISTS